jgi:hypothetical protein
MTVSENEVNLEAPAPVRRAVRRKPVRSQRVQLSKADVKAAADRAESGHRYTMKARPNWESEDFVGVAQDGSDRLNIPDEKLLPLAQDGWSFQWITRSIRGQETPQLISQMEKGGWTPVHQSDFDGMLDGLFMPKGHNETPIAVDDCMLVARPTLLHMKAERHQRKQANLPLQIAEEQIGQGIPGVTGAMAPGVRNSIKKTIERVEIPD